MSQTATAPERQGADNKKPKRRTEKSNWPDKQEVFSTGEAAKICNVSQQTIIRCFDSGRLNGFRVPSSRFRRIPRANLIAFMETNDLSLEHLEGDTRRILLIDDNQEVRDQLIALFEHHDHLKMTCASTGFDAGHLAEQTKPHLIIVAHPMPDLEVQSIRKHLNSDPSLEDTKLIVMVSNANDQDEINIKDDTGVDDVICKPFKLADLLRIIEQLLGLEPITA